MSEFVCVASVQDVPDPGRMLVEVDDRMIALFHVGGKFYAIDDVCTHDGGPLAEGTLANVRLRGPVKALTGPVRRGDTGTVQRHLEALDRLDFGAQYRMLGKIALELAKEAGLEPAAARRMQRALTEKSAATRRRRRE